MRASLRILAPLAALGASLAVSGSASAADGDVSGSNSAAPLIVMGIGLLLAIGLGSAFMFFRKPPPKADDDAPEDQGLER